MRERVTIQTFTEVDDGAGGCDETWSNLVTKVAARVQPVRGREDDVAGRQSGVQTYLVTMRYRTGFDETARIYVDSGFAQGETLNIRSIENRDEKRRFLTMECESGVTV